jgi:hypothetical protein
MIEHAKGRRIVGQLATHTRDEMTGLVISPGILSLVVPAVTGQVLPEGLAPVFLKPLIADAAHDLGEESGKRHFGRPRAASGEDPLKRLSEQIVAVMLPQSPRPGPGQCGKAHDFGLTEPSEHAPNLSEAKIRRVIVHRSPTKPSIEAMRRWWTIWDNRRRKIDDRG